MEEALEPQRAQKTTVVNYFLGVLKVPLASESIIRRKISCNVVLFGQNVQVTVHSGHICILSAFLGIIIIGNFLLNNGVDK